MGRAMATWFRRWQLLALLIGPVFLTLGLTAAANYYSHRVTVDGYKAASQRHVDTIRAGFEANEVSTQTLHLIQTIAEEINARRAGLRGPDDWPAFRQGQQVALALQQGRLQTLLETEQDLGRQQALRQALVLMADLERFLAQSDRLMSQPLDAVNRELLASRNTSLRYALQLQQFNEAMSTEAVAHLKESEFVAESHSWRSTVISGAGLLVAAGIWAVVALVLARRLEVLDNALRQLAQDNGHGAHGFDAVQHIARAHNPLTSTLARSVLTLQQVQTERDEAQVALREREQLFATIVQQAPAGIVLIERTTLRLLRFNEAACRSLGYHADEFAALTLRDLALGPREHAAELAEEVFAGKGVEFETRTPTKEGTPRDFWVSMKPLFLPGRDCISVIWLDITERKRTELELERHRQHLETLVAERTRDLERTQQDLIVARDMAESANRAKSAFLANMSHEIRTPMNAIVGMAHLLKNESLSPLQHQRVDKLTTAAMHLLTVINDILDFSKIEAGKFGIDPIDFNLEQVVSQAFAFVAEKAESKGLELVSDLGSVPMGLHGDPVRLGQILLNFLSNAVKFTEQGHVRLRVRAMPPQDDSATLWMRFEISDTGIGISQVHQARLFTAFQQADDSITRVYGGTGLGLAICRRLADLLGGRVGVHSQVGAGSTFWAELPFTAARSAPPVLHGFAPQTRVLVVDDMEEAREAVQMVLSQLGARVDLCADGEAALKQVAEADRAADPYAYVFSDWNMPGLDGAEVLRRIHRMGLPSLPIGVLFSGSTGSPERAMPEEGIHAFVTKPVLPSAVVAVLARTAPVGQMPDAASQAGRALQAFGTRFRPGLKLLLAEDNPLNREVLGELLEHLGLAVDCVPDGQAAVEAARQHAYDLVLMDLQMPRLDGLAAARLLRQLPGYQTTPIVAVTANAFDEDRMNALAAGMNDHVPKPVDPKALRAVLARWLPARDVTTEPGQGGHEGAVPDADTSRAAPDVEHERALAQVPGLNVAQALRHTGGSPRQLGERLRRFFAEHGDDVQRMTAAWARGDTEAAHRQAHTLRGVAGMFGLTDLSEDAHLIGVWLREGRHHDEPEARSVLQRMQTRLDQAREGLAAASAMLQPSDGDDVRSVDRSSEAGQDDAALKDSLVALKTLLEAGDMDAAAAWEAQTASVSARFPTVALEITRAMDVFDYARAADRVEQLCRALAP